MKKFDTLMNKMPIIYALFIPVNFYLHILGATVCNIHPAFFIVLDILRILVIALYGHYLALRYDESKNEKDVSNMFMSVSGIAFLAFVYSTVVSLGLSYVTRSANESIMVAAMVLELMIETIAFFHIAKQDAKLITVIWVGINIALGIVVLADLHNPGKSVFWYVMIALVARDLYKARIIYSQELVNQKQDVK